MRIGVFHSKPYYLRSYETALSALVERGHHLVLARPDRFQEVKVPSSVEASGRVSTALYPHQREDGLDRPIEILRTTRDAARYLKDELYAAHASRQRAFWRLRRAVRGDAPMPRLPVVDLPAVDWIGREALGGGLFDEIERVIPADRAFVRFLREQRLDLVFSVSRVNIASRQTELFKAAAHLGIPTGVATYSWDNLSNKGVLHLQPDRLFVWNEIQAREAAELHGLDTARIAVTGAPRFDSFFGRAPSADRETLLTGLGLDPARATILYLGSSAFVAPRETDFVTAWCASLRTGGDERLRQANLLVRPHPGAFGTKAWLDWRAPQGAVLTPRVTRSREQDLFDQLWLSDAVVGLNTSAEIEAAIVDRPVLTIKAGALAPGQEGQLHFRYILEEHDGFVQTAASLDEHFIQLRNTLLHDPLAGRRGRFLESFVRPRGLETPAGLVLADGIESLADRRSRRRPGPTRRGRVAVFMGDAYTAVARRVEAVFG